MDENKNYSRQPWEPGKYETGRTRPPKSHNGLIAILLVVGPLMDVGSVFTMGTTVSWKFALAVFAAGLVPNLILACATAVTMLLLSRPLLYKLDRVIRKYGMMEDA